MRHGMPATGDQAYYVARSVCAEAVLERLSLSVEVSGVFVNVSCPFLQLVPGHQSIAATRSRSRHRALVHKHQVVRREIVKPFVPRDGAEPRGGWKIEPDACIAVMHVDGGRPGLGRLSSRRLGLMLRGPSPNQLVIVGCDDCAGRLISFAVKIDATNPLGVRKK